MRRLVDESHATSRARRRDAAIVVGPEVVHDEHVAAAQPREQLSFQPVDEAVAVRRLPRRAQRDPAGPAYRAEQREILPAIHGNAIDELLAALHPGVTSAHRDAEPRFVEKDEPIGAQLPDVG